MTQKVREQWQEDQGRITGIVIFKGKMEENEPVLEMRRIFKKIQDENSFLNVHPTVLDAVNMSIG